MTLIEKYEDVTQRLEGLRKDRENILQEYADQNCRFKIGDTVDILGYSHRGKKGIIESIHGTFDHYRKEYQFRWIVRGSVLKKDGTKSCNNFEFNLSDYENFLEKEGCIMAVLRTKSITGD